MAMSDKSKLPFKHSYQFQKKEKKIIKRNEKTRQMNAVFLNLQVKALSVLKNSKFPFEIIWSYLTFYAPWSRREPASVSQ